MNKKQLLLAGVGVVFISMVSGLVWYISQHTFVTIELGTAVTRIDIYPPTSKTTPVASRTTSGTVWLKKGTYTIRPTNTNNTINTDPIPITIAAHTTIRIDPGYSTTYLAQRASEQHKTITESMTKRFGETLHGYTIAKVTLLRYGEWGGVLLTNPAALGRERLEYYRCVITQNTTSGEWSVVGVPQYILTVSNTSSVPRDILQSVNAMTVD